MRPFVIILNYVCFSLPHVACLSCRYGRQSTPEHNYLALQKSPCPQGKMVQRGTVIVAGDPHADKSFWLLLLPTAPLPQRKAHLRVIRSILKCTPIILSTSHPRVGERPAFCRGEPIMPVPSLASFRASRNDVVIKLLNIERQ